MRSIFQFGLVLFQNLLFWFLFVLFSAVFMAMVGLWLLTASLFCSKRRILRWLRRSISWYGWLAIYCAWPFVRFKYRDLSPDDEIEPSIFICNHRSATDPFMLCHLPIEGVQIAKSWPLQLPVLGVLGKLAGYICIQDIRLEDFYKQGEELLEQKVSLASFPEGTRSRDGRMGAFNSAVFRLAKNARATLVPLAISGTEKVNRPGTLLLRPGVVRVDKLPALAWEDYRNLSVFKLKTTVRQILCQHLNELESATEGS